MQRPTSFLLASPPTSQIIDLSLPVVTWMFSCGQLAVFMVVSVYFQLFWLNIWNKNLFQCNYVSFIYNIESKNRKYNMQRWPHRRYSRVGYMYRHLQWNKICSHHNSKTVYTSYEQKSSPLKEHDMWKCYTFLRWSDKALDTMQFDQFGEKPIKKDRWGFSRRHMVHLWLHEVLKTPFFFDNSVSPICFIRFYNIILVRLFLLLTVINNACGYKWNTYISLSK